MSRFGYGSYSKNMGVFSDMRCLVNRITSVYWRVYSVILLYKNKVSFSKTVRFSGKVIISVEKRLRKKIDYPTIYLGENLRVNSGIKHNLIGGDGCTILRTIDNGKIIIGDRVGMSNVTLVAFSSIKIGNDVLLGGGVKIYDTDFHSLCYEDRIKRNDTEIPTKPVEIGDGVFIGAGSIILKGVKIGNKSIVGAGSVVRCDIPDGEIWMGNPAVFYRKAPEK